VRGKYSVTCSGTRLLQCTPATLHAEACAEDPVTPGVCFASRLFLLETLTEDFCTLVLTADSFELMNYLWRNCRFCEFWQSVECSYGNTDDEWISDRDETT